MFWECKEAFANETWASGWTNLPRDWRDDDDHANKALCIMGDAFRYHKQQNPLWQFMVEDLDSVEVCVDIKDAKDDVKAQTVLNSHPMVYGDASCETTPLAASHTL